MTSIRPFSLSSIARSGALQRFAAGAAIGLALVGGTAMAQEFGRHDVNAPVNFAADRIELQQRADRVIVSGNVVVTKAGMQLNAQRMTIAYTQAGKTQVDRIDASGGVTVKRGDQSARGDVAIYDLNRKLITMLGGVTLTQGQNRLNGGRLVIDLTSGRAVVDGSGGRSEPVRLPDGSIAPGSGGGRVTGSFTVPQRNGG